MPDETAFASAAGAAAASTTGAASNASLRRCEGCATQHGGSYGSGRFCSATCAKKVGARRKWATTSRVPRAKRPSAPCEGCRRVHDRSYASGRFCSVQCARRVAAARKWDKCRLDRARRLDAIKGEGKRRRLADASAARRAPCHKSAQGATSIEREMGNGIAPCVVQRQWCPGVLLPPQWVRFDPVVQLHPGGVLLPRVAYPVQHFAPYQAHVVPQPALRLVQIPPPQKTVQGGAAQGAAEALLSLHANEGKTHPTAPL